MSESLVAERLEAKGFKVVARNYSCRFGEIDIVAVKDGVIWFVEVRSRWIGAGGNLAVKAVETVGALKLQRILKTSDFFIQERGLSNIDRNVLVVEVNWYNRSRVRVRMIPVY
ncbi:YraN family protein [Candidatus Dojkabacteria bacterium]|nr:YraN family protein [Candidatus Dojkabacteria bacterium]